MGIFKKRHEAVFEKNWAYSAVEVQLMMDPFLNNIKEIVVRHNNFDRRSTNWIVEAREIVAYIYVNMAATSIYAKKIHLLFLSKKISSHAHLAAMNTFNFFHDTEDELLSYYTTLLIDYGCSYKEGIEFFKSSWDIALELAPHKVKKLQADMNGAFKWDWINESTWV